MNVDGSVTIRKPIKVADYPTKTANEMSGEWYYGFSIATVNTSENRSYVRAISLAYAPIGTLNIEPTTRITVNTVPVDAYRLAKWLATDMPTGTIRRVAAWAKGNATMSYPIADQLAFTTAEPRPNVVIPYTQTPAVQSSGDTVCTVDPITGVKTCQPAPAAMPASYPWSSLATGNYGNPILQFPQMIFRQDDGGGTCVNCNRGRR